VIFAVNVAIMRVWITTGYLIVAFIWQFRMTQNSLGLSRRINVLCSYLSYHDEQFPEPNSKDCWRGHIFNVGSAISFSEKMPESRGDSRPHTRLKVCPNTSASSFFPALSAKSLLAHDVDLEMQARRSG
jgi:hypothetical protein